IVNRQLVVRFEAGKMHVGVQPEIRNQTTEISLERPVTEDHEIPRRALLADVRALTSDLRPLSIFFVSPDEPRQILLLDEPRRSNKVILRQPILSSNFEFRISNFDGTSRKVSVIDYIVSGKDAVTRHPKLNQIFNVTLTAYQRS